MPSSISQNIKIAWIGELGFPSGLAGTQRIILIFNGMKPYGVAGTVINTFGIHDPEEKPGIEAEGIYKNIKYVHASGSTYRPRNCFVRNILKLQGMINEIFIIYRLRKSGQLDAAILQAETFKAILFYRILSKLMGFTLIMNYVELVSSFSTKWGIGHKLDSFLYEKYGYFLIDGIMPISDYLFDIVKSRNPQLPILKVPMITDFDRFKGVEPTVNEKYFLFCGSAAYLEIIVFILKAFELLKSSEETKLYLVVNGSTNEISRLREDISNNKKSGLIELYSRISDAQLTELYAGACGLLIPLRPTIQDHARFPHKLGEYLASGNPVVTTNCGEITKYFEDGKSALIAQHYDISEFAEKMKYIILNPGKAKEIGQEGRRIGLENFDYKIYGLKIRDFIASVINRKR